MKVSICYQWKRKSRNWNTKKFKSIIDYSQTTDDVCENLKDYNTTKKKRVLIVLDDTIADIKSNKKLTRINTELFSRGIKPNISLVFVSQSYFKKPKTIFVTKENFNQ